MCQQKKVIYQASVEVDGEPDRVYLGVTESSWKVRFYNHKTLVNNSMKTAQYYRNIDTDRQNV